MSPQIRIGTRDSELAVWQATQVKEGLDRFGCHSSLVFVKSDGDLNLSAPLHQTETIGLFTRTLDLALLNGEIDLAVHSLKDLPTQLTKGILQVAVLPRGPVLDVLVCRGSTRFLDHPSQAASIATGSLRRKAQWLNKYPGHHIEPIRGNVRTRLEKLKHSHWDGAIFAAAGLDRLEIRDVNSLTLNWMLPAPAQGAIALICRQADKEMIRQCGILNDGKTQLCVHQEREFLQVLEGGCSAPIGAYCWIEEEWVHFQGNILSLEKREVFRKATMEQSGDLGKNAAEELLDQGANLILEQIKHAPR